MLTGFSIDNSGWSRDEDYNPSRWKAQQNALQLIVMGDNNNNNSYTVIATAGKRYIVNTVNCIFKCLIFESSVKIKY